MKPKLVVLHSWEKLQFFEKKFFEKKKKKKKKKSLQLICADNIFKIFGGNFFKIKWSRDI